VVRDGLDAYRVLVLPFCDVLTDGVVQRIRHFQKRGGIVIADEFLCPAIIPDLVLSSLKRSGKADADKAALQAKAAELRRELDAFYTRYGDSPNPDIVLRFRQYRDSDYLFVLNDKRTFGNYVGHHAKVMEKGLPNPATLAVRRKTGFVYDLVQHQAVPVRTSAGGIQFDASFGPGDGRVYLLTSREIAGVHIKAPATAKRGGSADVTVAVGARRGAPVAAIVPVHVGIIDPQGHPAEFSGYYGARDGKVSLRLALAANDATGTWLIRAQELASGIVQEARLTVVP
jgi:hypothetical protein